MTWFYLNVITVEENQEDKCAKNCEYSSVNADCTKRYCVVIDGTVDVSGTDPMSIVARFVGLISAGLVQERLLSLDVMTSATAEALWKLLSTKLQKRDLQFQTLIGLSIVSMDGASASIKKLMFWLLTATVYLQSFLSGVCTMAKSGCRLCSRGDSELRNLLRLL